jgi:hypothetical protein
VAALRKIVSADYSFHSGAWDGVSDDAKQFISALLVADPTRRATAKDAGDDAPYEK